MALCAAQYPSSNRRRVHFLSPVHARTKRIRPAASLSTTLVGKYPPAEPGALGIGPLEAATLNPKLCLLGRRTKYALPTSPRSFIQFFATLENRCLLRIASPLDGVKVSRLSIVKLHFVCVVAHDLRSRRRATAVNVKLILPPRQSRGVSRLC